MDESETGHGRQPRAWRVIRAMARQLEAALERLDAAIEEGAETGEIGPAAAERLRGCRREADALAEGIADAVARVAPRLDKAARLLAWPGDDAPQPAA